MELFSSLESMITIDVLIYSVQRYLPDDTGFFVNGGNFNGCCTFLNNLGEVWLLDVGVLPRIVIDDFYQDNSIIVKDTERMRLPTSIRSCADAFRRWFDEIICSLSDAIESLVPEICEFRVLLEQILVFH